MLKTLALRAGARVEGLLEKIGDRDDSAPVLDPYIGYATPDGWVLRARVLSHLRRAEPVPEQSRWTNLRQMTNLFITDEVSGVTVEAAGVVGTSDAEGYVTMTVPAQPADGAWADVTMKIAGTGDAAAEADCPVRLYGAEARHIVISDVDDTMIVTGAHNLATNLWTTFTGSALTRKVYPDAVRLMERLAPGGPVFYVSSSPWNLHAFLETLLFARSGLPRGPMFLRDLGLTEDGVGQSHLGHKGAAIDTILAAVPELPVYLLGDTGQKDSAVYLEAARRHPGRIAGVGLREPAEGVSGDDADQIAALEALGIPVWHGQFFDGAAEHWGTDEPLRRS
ncbi:phosphatase domain-containing protein [Jannaschia aquimarina]|uniref:Phosphatidate phosphatase APP1 catalytic domain-containing protein n=1 Tax=Jannaschia aquimarina TaxID=935700 RepID=A0A0D1D5V8_9RHOB|nr:phosphatase domain-containing protein [Jannaschia aquimarina]KIT15338.1 hypothetical protein jaqu_29530 [Jannaschia aquimarina]SNS51573.1 Uncharacterized conserved protein [Jannaschia aquimarina]